MTAATAPPAFDYPRLQRLLDLEPAHTPAEQVRLLQEARAQYLDELNANVPASWPDGLRLLIDAVDELRRSDIAVIEEALTAAGQPFTNPDDLGAEA